MLAESHTMTHVLAGDRSQPPRVPSVKKRVQLVLHGSSSGSDSDASEQRVGVIHEDDGEQRESAL